MSVYSVEAVPLRDGFDERLLGIAASLETKADKSYAAGHECARQLLHGEARRRLMFSHVLLREAKRLRLSLTEP